jgi:ABC-type Na+ efflux pump permease subunit
VLISLTLKGYTAASPLGKSAAIIQPKRTAMPRIAILIIILVLIIGALVFLSTVPKERPTRTIEVEVPTGGNAH